MVCVFKIEECVNKQRDGKWEAEATEKKNYSKRAMQSTGAGINLTQNWKEKRGKKRPWMEIYRILYRGRPES